MIFHLSVTSIFLSPLAGKLDEDKVLKFGSSKELIKSAANTLKGKSDPPNHLGDSIEEAHQVASCDYVHNTSWGAKVSNQKIRKPQIERSY